jgi:hypothetical protein
MQEDRMAKGLLADGLESDPALKHPNPPWHGYGWKILKEKKLINVA